MSAIIEGGMRDLRVSNRQLATALIASVLGWSLDLFDLFTLLYVAPVIGSLFFPSTQPTLSLAAVYASFAVTLLMRPVGSAIFGSYADRNGRKGAMVIAVVGVGLATAAFGLLPTVEMIGVGAPILFLDSSAHSGRVRRWRGRVHFIPSAPRPSRRAGAAQYQASSAAAARASARSLPRLSTTSPPRYFPARLLPPGAGVSCSSPAF